MKNKLKHTLLVASISSIMLAGLTACGGSEYITQDCNGSASIGCGSKPDQPDTVVKNPSSPKAKADTVSTNYNTPVLINVLGNDTDADNDIDASTLKLIDPSNNQLVNEVSVMDKGVWKVQSGKVLFTPAASLEDTAVTIRYSIDDKDAKTSASTAQITVNVGKNGQVTPIETFDWSDLDRDSNSLQAMTQANLATWQASSSDETPKDVSIAGDTAVVATYWHNKAHSFKLTDNVATLQADFDFATNSGARHDVVSGASEQLLDDIMTSDDGSLLIGSVVKAGENSTGETGVGLYVSQKDSSGSFTPVAHANDNTSSQSAYYSYPNITAQAINNANKHIAIANTSGEIKILSTDLNKTIASTSVDFAISSLAFSDDGKQLFVSGKKKTGLFSSEGIAVMLKTDDNLNQGWLWKTNNSLTQLISLGDSRVLVKASSGNQIYVLGDAQSTQSDAEPQVKAITSAGSSTDIAVSSNHELIAVSQLNQVEVINLTNGKRAAVNINGKVGGIALSDSQDNKYLWVATKGKFMSYNFPSEILN